MSTTDKHGAGSTRLDKLRASANLTDCLATVLSERNLPSVSDGNFDSLNHRDKSKAKKWKFGTELEIAVPVNLSDSKKAFNIFMAGLENHDTFTGMWNLCPYDLYDFLHPHRSIAGNTLKVMEGILGEDQTGLSE